MCSTPNLGPESVVWFAYPKVVSLVYFRYRACGWVHMLRAKGPGIAKYMHESLYRSSGSPNLRVTIRSSLRVMVVLLTLPLVVC